jgi:cation-transporting P-type ATPase F
MLDASGHRVPLDVAEVQRQLESLAVKGLRVLVLASADLPGDKQSINHADVNELTFLGLQGMIDPPRPEAISAVRPASRLAFTSR